MGKNHEKLVFPEKTSPSKRQVAAFIQSHDFIFALTILRKRRKSDDHQIP
jgi:hypothetical protein